MGMSHNEVDRLPARARRQVQQQLDRQKDRNRETARREAKPEYREVEAIEVNGYSAICIELPFPVTVNHYWDIFPNKHTGRQIVKISDRGLEYRRAVMMLVSVKEPFRRRLSLKVVAHMPDRRARDLDNLLKSIQDSLAHAGAYVDDKQIDHMEVDRIKLPLGAKPWAGKVVVTIEELPEGPLMEQGGE